MRLARASAQNYLCINPCHRLRLRGKLVGDGAKMHETGDSRHESLMVQAQHDHDIALHFFASWQWMAIARDAFITGYQVDDSLAAARQACLGQQPGDGMFRHTWLDSVHNFCNSSASQRANMLQALDFLCLQVGAQCLKITAQVDSFPWAILRATLSSDEPW